MKLKNRNTGVIGDLVAYDADKGIFAVKAQGGDRCYYYSLAALYEVWEDYEEPKEYWYIDDFMIMCGTEGEFTTPDLASFTRKDIEKLKKIGNYFSSREEAEKAVEKLKAWKRLKDKGFRFNGYEHMMSPGHKQRVYVDWFIPLDYEKYIPDLDLLFFGEDD